MDMPFGLKDIVCKSIFILKYILYEIKYYLMGVEAMIEDIILRRDNICAPFSKKGDIAVVTGGARGIGAALVKKLLECDMHVIIGCRNVEAGLNCIHDIRKKGIITGSTSVLQLDLKSFVSIKNFAQAVAGNVGYVNLLVNNAGIMFAPYEETESGFESHWAVNYLGPFLLTHYLLELLNNCAQGINARIINVTSCAHSAAHPICFENINMRSSYIPSAAYAQSKLAQILFTKELQRRLKQSNLHIDVFAVHPGIVDTELFDGTILKKLFPWVLTSLCKDVEAGATTVLYPCISTVLDGKGGNYISNCRIVSPSKMAENVQTQDQLFTETLTALKIEEYGKTDLTKIF